MQKKSKHQNLVHEEKMESMMIHEAGNLEEKKSGVVIRYEKNVCAAANPISFGLIKNTYRDAIEYTGIAKGTRGMIMLAGLLAASFMLWAARATSLDFLENNKPNALNLILLFVPVICFIFGIYVGVKYIRIELFRPEDEPIIFDRKNRKVYRVFRETYSGWRGLFLFWPLKSAEYDWDLVDVEHQAVLTTTGSTITRIHALIFLVRQSSSDPTIVASFMVGNSMQMGEVTVPAVWEHIRRFMEEDGPHLEPGEVLQSFDPPNGFWQCMAATGPYGKNFLRWWKDYTLLMVMGVIFFPIVFPLMTLVGIFSWLSYKTAIPIKWSPEVRAALGC